MTSPTPQLSHCRGHKSLVLSIRLLCLLFLTVSNSWASSGKTLFLPLNIKSADNVNQLSNLADEKVQATISGRDISFIPRNEAQKLADYSGNWPPAADILQKISTKTEADNIVAGNLTVIGSQVALDVKLFDLFAPTTPTYYFKTGNSLDDLPVMLSEVAGEIANYLSNDFKIASIAPDGNKRIDSGAILSKIETKPGDIYNQATLRNDLKSIYKMGYFNDVQIDVSDSSKGKKIIFRVVEKPVIKSVLYKGIDELKEEDVKAAANIKEHFILNPAKISQAEEAIRQLYKTKGFYNSKVSSNISYPDEAGAVVEFVIDEGKEIYIKEISFEGNATFDADELRDQIDTGERWFMSWLTESGLLDRNKIEQDGQKIVAFYNNNGFLEAKIGEPVITQKDEWLYIKFIIEEGPRFRVGTVDFTGDILTNKNDLLNLLTIRKEKFLSRQTVRDDIMKMTDYYAESGYAFASIRPRITKSAIGNRMDIVFDIDKANLVYINRITIKGNSRTRDNVIRRELRISEGGVFDSKAIRTSTQALQRLAYFEEVNITPEPSADPDRMNVIIQVKEKSTGTFSIGMGYSTSDNLILMGQISENNFLGRGDTVSLSANVSSSSSLYNLAYTNPHLNDSELSWGVDLFKTEREYDDYTKDSTGGGVRIGYPVFEKWKLFSNYSLTDTDLTDVSDDASYIIRNSVDLHLTSAMKFSLVRDTTNLKYSATKGSRNVVSVKYAGGPLGGDAQFTKVEGSTSWYFPMIARTVFHVKGSAGQVFENETDKLPVYERFYLGGLNSMRGFEYASISPTDPDTGEDIGGDKMWYTNTEVIFPLLESQGINGVVFYDVGQVLNDDEEFFGETSSIKQAVGLGFRWLSPMGPLQVFWGYNLDPDEDESTSEWDFSVGGSF